MIAELKELYSLDVECPLQEYRPREADNFELTLRAMYGPVGEDSSESFQIQICTPKWLKARCDEGEIVSGRHTIIVGYFSFNQIHGYLSALGRRCSGSSWAEISQKLGRYGLWEFEDYRPSL
jgi:hypothetical protein